MHCVQAIVGADYIIKLQLEKYHNPSNILANGQCCGAEATLEQCLEPCDSHLFLCLREAQQPHDDHNCTIGEIHALSTESRGIWFSVSGAWPVSNLAYTGNCLSISSHACRGKVTCWLTVKGTFDPHC